MLISLALAKSYISTAKDRDNFSSTKTVITATILLPFCSPLRLVYRYNVAFVWISIILVATRLKTFLLVLLVCTKRCVHDFSLVGAPLRFVGMDPVDGVSLFSRDNRVEGENK